MLVRELAARYLGAGGLIRVDADPQDLADIGQAGPVVDLDGGGDAAPGDVVLISVDPSADNLPDRLAKVTEQGDTVLLLLPVSAGEVPVGRLAQAAGTARLAFVEIAPIEPAGSVRTVVECRPSSRPVPVQAFLGDGTAAQDEVDLDRQGLRIGWEWGLGDARARALEEFERAARTRADQLEQGLAAVRRALDQAGKDLEVQRGVAERAEARADADARRRGAMQQSSSFLVGRAVLSVRHHPLRAVRKLPRATLRAIRRSVWR
jgi:hypothetical protein